MKSRILSGTITIGLALGFSAAMAQGVLDRSRPDYDAKGLPFGAFRLFPTIGLGLTSDSNIFRTSVGEISDIFYTISPRAVLQSEWSNHQLVITGGLDSYQYQYNDNGSQSRTDWDIGGTTRIDVARGTVITGAASYVSTHEARTSPNFAGFAAEPTPYTVTHLEAKISSRPNRFGAAAGVTYDIHNYSSTNLLPPGGFLNNDDRDRGLVGVFGEFSYEFQPGTAFFVRGTYDDRDFDVLLDRTGVNRDSNGYSIDGGLKMLVSPLIQGEVFIGYFAQNYLAPLTDINGINFGAELDWLVTPLTTIHINAERSVGDTILAGTTASDDISFGLGFDHELLRNVLIESDGSYAVSRFKGTGREDNILGARFSLRYLMNSYASITAAYRYSTRDSNVAGQSFDDHAISAGVRLQL